MITELEFKAWPAKAINVFRSWLRPLRTWKPLLSAVPEAGTPRTAASTAFCWNPWWAAAFGRWLHRSARPHPAARQWLPGRCAHRSRDRRPGGETAAGNPLDFIAEYQKALPRGFAPGLPRFCGGLAGYFGYDAVRYIEKKPKIHLPPTPWAAPTFCCCSAEELAVIDNLSGKLYLIVYADPAQPEAYHPGKQRRVTSRTSPSTR